MNIVCGNINQDLYNKFQILYSYESICKLTYWYNGNLNDYFGAIIILHFLKCYFGNYSIILYFLLASLPKSVW